MARKRTKKRTHLGASNPDVDSAGHASAKDPKSMVIRIGAGEVGSSVSQLAADVRKVMEPGTAARLKERRGNRLKDYASMCGPLGVTHLMLFSRSESGNTNLRMALTPRGPTMNFRVEKYSLCKDVQRAQKHPKGGGKEFITPPLLVMNNFTRPDSNSKSKVPKHLESLATTVFQSLFPPINPQATPLKSIRRVLLLNREQSEEDDGTFIINFRHYAITTKSTTVSKPLRRLNAAEQFVTTKTSRKGKMPNLGKLEDVADFLIGGENGDGYMTDATSGSEMDTDAEVEILDSTTRKVLSAKARQAAAQNDAEPEAEEENVERRAVKLVELGPRMRLRLTKVEEGLADGKVMWHDNARYVWSSAAVIGTGTGVYLFNGKGTTKSLTNEVPSLKDFSSEDQIPINSPVKEFIMEDANAKLREDAHTFVFDGNGGVKGRVDFARLGSNNPIEDEWDLKIAKGVGGTNTLYAGVYDGHAGWATSKVLRAALVPYVSNALSSVTPTSSNELVDDAIKKAFVRLDDRIFRNAQEALESGQDQGSAAVIIAVAPAIAGSCALLTMYEPKTSTLRTAVAGDSRAVRGMWSPNTSKYEVDVLSKDQTGFNQDEVERLDKEHPGEIKDMINTESGRLFGMAITRAFGDHRWKWSEELIRKVKDDFYGTAPRPNAKTQPYMTARPEVTTRKIQTEDFVILASDGLWDMMSNEDAVSCVSRWLVAKKNGKPEPFKETKFEGKLEDGWKATPEHQVIEDLDNAAVCLVKNALGGSRRGLFLGAMTTYPPMSRNVRDDMTVQVIFFKDPYEKK
ncbi:hypothetical protein AU210_011898 [Fusarium oxysporum f. sp. radicis-cucumerinum]|uniref:PPM-type phosphatase domain-containing protein n=1 Tax=Fusarium oxysporum f. sp. radicis-cucumerinum TaxID=327505 RepID=A0A2H3GHZ8_FUSOX|nr:hypothetical protein AU210_011898 [Fusarium oxysporum f. sp. radicis-cucumerinum]